MTEFGKWFSFKYLCLTESYNRSVIFSENLVHMHFIWTHIHTHINRSKIVSMDLLANEIIVNLIKNYKTSFKLETYPIVIHCHLPCDRLYRIPSANVVCIFPFDYKTWLDLKCFPPKRLTFYMRLCLILILMLLIASNPQDIPICDRRNWL